MEDLDEVEVHAEYRKSVGNSLREARFEIARLRKRLHERLDGGDVIRVMTVEPDGVGKLTYTPIDLVRPC